MVASLSWKRTAVALLWLVPDLALAQTTKAVDLQSCLESTGIHSLIDGDDSFDAANVGFQKRLGKPQPAAIAYPTDREQVALALGCARNVSVPVNAYGHGHSFQNFGFGYPGNLVINMDHFDAVRYNKDDLTVTYEGGTHVGPVVKYLWETAGRHFPHVRHGHVGTTGSTIGGGFGSTSRHLGTPLDNIVAAEIMLYNGTIVHAGLGHELLWAVKGAASSYGIILSLTSKTYKPDYERAINFTLTVGASPIFDVDLAAEVIVATQEFAELPNTDRLALRWSLTAAPLAGTGYFYGNPITFDHIIAPLLKKLRTLNKDVKLAKTELSFWDMELAASGGLNEPNGGSLGAGRSFFGQSYITTRDHPLTLEQARLIFTAANVNFNRTDLVKSGLFDLWAGVSRDVKDSSSSWIHRNNQWLIRFDGVSTNISAFPADGTSYLKNLTKPFEEALLSSGASLRGFMNYADTELTVEEWSSRFYGSANFKRLQDIKGSVDPESVFTNRIQAIPLPDSNN